MRYRTLGKTGIKVSEIGLGTWAMSGRGYGPTNDSESVAALYRALDLGINFIDTADSYGNGHSEKLIGTVLKERNDKDTLICTKFGWDFYNKDGIRSNLGREYILYAVEQSLKRLNRDRIDLYLIHSQNPAHIIDCDVYNTLEFLKRDGRICHYGLSISDYYAKEYSSLILDTDWDVVELTFNLLDRNAKDIFFETCFEKSMGIIVKEPLANGLLSGKYSRYSFFDKNDHRNGWRQHYLEYRLEMVNRIKNHLNLSNSDMIKASIKYILNHNAVSTVIPGVKNIEQLTENLSALDYDLDERAVSYIEQN